MSDSLLRTPLHAFHLQHRAHMVEFAGWHMPLFYRSVIDEHRHVRRSAGLFDVSHMGRLRITGRHARRCLERACTRRISDMAPGQCRYSLICNQAGGVRDDVIVYRFDEDEFLLVVNAANRLKLLDHFQHLAATENFAVRIEDQTLTTAMVALQGPRAMDLVARFSTEIPTLKRYRFTVKNLLVLRIIVSRTGYTGEDGIEAILPASAVSLAMSLLLRDVDFDAPDAVLRPAGLGARDTLRLEAGMPLYGHELSEETPAIECGVDFAITLDKDQAEGGTPFIGQDALRRMLDAGGPRRRLMGIRLAGQRAARQGHHVLIHDRVVGVVTSGALSPTLGYPIAMAFIESALAEPGTAIHIATGREILQGQLTSLPFYTSPAT